MSKGIVEKILIGKSKTMGEKNANNPMDREWTSGIFKEPVKGPVWLSKTNLTGDGQADLQHHGGLENAVFVYPIEHYSKWLTELKLADLTIGAMGENFALSGQLEEDVCIGDIYKMGEALTLSERPYPQWTIARCNEIMHIMKKDLKAAAELASCKLLAENWKKTLHTRVEKGENPDINKRVYGPNI
ncbi:MOSC domain-containing protein [Priestia abyssalis]|uniref:MOSC domain-containing protein n=1 Tax=Priestia abyssalis TaxID=1221450 RepID=UPI0009959EE7|nr:MOSC domain-containing protein [Priestia abyssalis]